MIRDGNCSCELDHVVLRLSYHCACFLLKLHFVILKPNYGWYCLTVLLRHDYLKVSVILRFLGLKLVVHIPNFIRKCSNYELFNRNMWGEKESSAENFCKTLWIAQGRIHLPH